MRTFTLELALAGLLVVGGGCKPDETGDTGQETGDTEVPTTETDCADGDDNDQDGDEDCADSDCVSDADCTFVPFMVSASGFFAYTSDDEVTSYIVGGQTQAPAIVIDLGTEDLADTKDVDNDACQIVLTYNGSTALTLGEDTAGNRVVAMPAGQYDIEESCSKLNFDESVIGTIEEIAAANWELVVSETVDKDAKDAAISQGVTEYVGGGYTTELLGGQFVNFGVSLAFEIDVDGNLLNTDGAIWDPEVTTQEPAQVLAADIVAVDSILAPGAYTVASFYYVGLQ